MEVKVSAKTTSAKNHEAIYQLDVRSTAHVWKVFKNYKNFINLHASLDKMFPKGDLTLPSAQDASGANGKHRQTQMIHDYVQSVVKNAQYANAEAVLNFFEVPLSLRTLADADPPSSGLVKDFLRQLKEDRNKVKAIKSFETLFLGDKTKPSAAEIKRLFCGGLLGVSGDFKTSFTMASTALQLVHDLLDVEKYAEAETCLEALCGLHDCDLRPMRLHQHILSERGSKITAFRIIALVLPRRKRFLQDCVEDEWSRAEFARWYEFYSDKYKGSRPGALRPSLGDAPKLKTLDTAAFAAQVAAQVVAALDEKEDGPKMYRWRFFDKRFLLRYKHNPRLNTTTLKFKFAVPCSLPALSAVLCDPRSWPQWCKVLRSCAVLKSDGEDGCVVQLSFKSSLSPYKCHEACLFTRWATNGGDSFVLAAHSVETDLFVVKPSMKKSTFVSSGLRATKVAGAGGEDKGIEVECVVKFKDDAISVFSSDLLGESSNMVDSITGLIKVCCSQ